MVSCVFANSKEIASVASFLYLLITQLQAAEAIFSDPAEHQKL